MQHQMQIVAKDNCTSSVSEDHVLSLWRIDVFFLIGNCILSSVCIILNCVLNTKQLVPSPPIDVSFFTSVLRLGFQMLWIRHSMNNKDNKDDVNRIPSSLVLGTRQWQKLGWGLILSPVIVNSVKENDNEWDENENDGEYEFGVFLPLLLLMKIVYWFGQGPHVLPKYVDFENISYGPQFHAVWQNIFIWISRYYIMSMYIGASCLHHHRVICLMD